MIVLLLSPVYILLNIYILARLLHFFGAIHERLKHPIVWSVSIITYSFFMLTPVTGYLIQKEPWHYTLKWLSNYWLGVLAIGFVVLIFFDISRIFLNKVLWKEDHPNERRLKIGGTCAIVIIALISVYSNSHSKDVKLNINKLDVNKAINTETKIEMKNGLKIALVSDIHLGYSTSEDHIQSMVDKINQQKPDLIVIGGDTFDNDYKAIKNPDKLIKILSGLKSTYGVYACWGNHDIPETLLVGFTLKLQKDYLEDSNYANFLKKSNIKILDDETRLIDDSFYLIGRKDPQRSEKLKTERKEVAELTENLDKSKPIIMMDHQPYELEKAANAGVDIDLSGHTHDGQIFPGNLTVGLMWENSYGVIKKGDMYSCVTSGVGVWGPAMRLGTDSEIMILDVKFKQAD